MFYQFYGMKVKPKMMKMIVNQLNYPCTKASNNNTKIVPSPTLWFVFILGFNGCVFGSIFYGLNGRILPDIKQTNSTGEGCAFLVILYVGSMQIPYTIGALIDVNNIFDNEFVSECEFDRDTLTTKLVDAIGIKNENEFNPYTSNNLQQTHKKIKKKVQPLFHHKQKIQD